LFRAELHEQRVASPHYLGDRHHGVTILAQRGTPLPLPAPATIFKPLAEGGVLFSTESEVYFGVNLIGARIWQLLPPVTATFEELCAKLAAQYHDVSEEQIQRDVRRFLDDLISNALVVVNSAHDEADPSVSERSR